MKLVFSKKFNASLFIYFLLLGGVILLPCCQKKEVTPPSPSQSTPFSIYLTDAPADYKTILIDIQKIWVNATDSTGTNSGWLEVPLTRAGQYNLMDFRNGNDTLLAKADLPSGSITKMRIELGGDNRLIFDDVDSIPLSLPSDDESSIKWDIQVNLTPETPYALVLDFNTAQSVVQAGKDSNYLLLPHFRTFARGSGGAIEGTVLPDSARVRINAIAGEDTLSAIPDTSGYYKFLGMDAGAYQLFFIPDSSAFISDTLDNIEVSNGQVTQVDTVQLVQ